MPSRAPDALHTPHKESDPFCECWLLLRGWSCPEGISKPFGRSIREVHSGGVFLYNSCSFRVSDRAAPQTRAGYRHPYGKRRQRISLVSLGLGHDTLTLDFRSLIRRDLVEPPVRSRYIRQDSCELCSIYNSFGLECTLTRVFAPRG